MIFLFQSVLKSLGNTFLNIFFTLSFKVALTSKLNFKNAIKKKDVVKRVKPKFKNLLQYYSNISSVYSKVYTKASQEFIKIYYY